MVVRLLVMRLCATVYVARTEPLQHSCELLMSGGVLFLGDNTLQHVDLQRHFVHKGRPHVRHFSDSIAHLGHRAYTQIMANKRNVKNKENKNIR